MQEKLIGELIGLARATDGNEHLINPSATAVIIESLWAVLPDSNCESAVLERLLGRVEEEKRNMVPDCFLCACPCGKNNAYDLKQLHREHPDIRSLKIRLLSGICHMAANVRQAAVSGCCDETMEHFFYKALTVIGIEGFTPEMLQPILEEMDELTV